MSLRFVMPQKYKIEPRNIIAPIFIIGTLLYAVSYVFSDFDDVLSAIAGIDLRLLCVVLALSLVNYVLRFWRWKLFIGEPSTALPAGRHFTIYMAGFALTATPGKVGEAMRTFYLRSYGVSAARSLAALYAERLFDVIVISILAMLLFTASGAATRWVGLLGAGVAAVLIAAQHPAAINCLNRFVRPLAGQRIQSLIDAVTAFLRDVRSMMTPRLLVAGTLLGILAWGAEGIGTYLVVSGLDTEIGVSLATGIYATAMLAGALSFLPGGLGSTEIVMISLLVSAGAPPPVAVAATMIVRLATLWFAVVLGLVAWLGIEMFRSTVSGGLERLSEKE